MSSYSQGSVMYSDRPTVDGRQSYLLNNSLRGSSPVPSENGNTSVRGGVGLVFRKDDGPTPSSFLIVSEVLHGGPAFKSGMIKAGDRLRKIDGVELGSAPEEESPQLPGPHGSPVTLTLERPSRGIRFDPTVGILSYNIKLTRSSNFFPDKLQSTADARNAQLAQKEREARYEARYGAGGAGWYSSGYEKLAQMAASMNDESVEGNGLQSTPTTRSTPFEKTIASFPPMLDSTAFSRQPDISDFEGDGLIGEAEEKLAKDEVESLRKYVAKLQEELAARKTLEVRAQSLEHDLKQEQARREVLELRQTKDVLREQLMQEEINMLRSEDREVDLKVLVRGKMDQLMREREILLADLRHNQVQHRAEVQDLQEKIARLQREKDEIRIDMRIEADGERTKQQERYQEYHAKTTNAMKALAQDLADAVREKEEAKAALTKFRIGDGALWEEENYSLKDKNVDLRSRLDEEHKKAEKLLEAQKKAEKLAKEVVRLRAELKREKGDGSREASPTRSAREDSPITREVHLPPADYQRPDTPPRRPDTPPLEKVRAAPPVEQVSRAMPSPPVAESKPTRAADEVVLAAKERDPTEEIMALYLNGAQADTPMPISPEKRADLNDLEEEGIEGPFPLGKRGLLVDVVVAKARQLPGGEAAGDRENYVVVSFRGNPIGTTEKKKGDLPVWNQAFKESLAEGTMGLVSIVLYQNKVGAGQGVKSECVGYVAVPLERVMKSGLEEGWYDLLDQDNQPVTGPGGSAEVLVRVSAKEVEERLKSMSGWVRSQIPGTAKDSPVHSYVWQLDPYAGVIRCSKAMASATELGDEEWRLVLKDWEVVNDQAAVRSVAGKVAGGVDGFCFLLSKKEERETLLVEVTSESKRINWVAALAYTGGFHEGGGRIEPEAAERVLERAAVDPEEEVVVEQPLAIVDVWVLGSRNLPVGTARGVVCEVQVGKQHRSVSAAEAAAAVTWNESVQLGILDPNEHLVVTIREPGMLGTTVGVVDLGAVRHAAGGDGWVGTDGWVRLEEMVARTQDQANMGSAEVRLHVAAREVTEELLAESGGIGWMDKVDATEPRKVFAVLDPYTQDLRLFPDREAAVLGERGRLAGSSKKEPLAHFGVRGCEVTRLDTTPSHDGTVMMSVQPAEGEPGTSAAARLVAHSADSYVRWKNALNRVARNPTKTRIMPKAGPAHAVVQAKVVDNAPAPAPAPALQQAPGWQPPPGWQPVLQPAGSQTAWQAPAPPAATPAVPTVQGMLAPAPPAVPAEAAVPAAKVRPPPPSEIEEESPAKPEPVVSVTKLSGPRGLLDIGIKVPKALVEVFVFRAQDLPILPELEGPGPKRVWGVVRAGDEQATTRKLDYGTGSIMWDETFQMGARGEASDLVTIILWASEGSNEPVCVGHIAVPIARVQATGQEEGWYEVRDRTGQVVKGVKGASMIRAGIVFRQVPKDLARGRARIAGWLVMKCADKEGGEMVPHKVLGVLNPFLEQLQVFATEADARSMENALAVNNLPGSHSEAYSSFGPEYQAVVASERRAGQGVWEDGFEIVRKDKRVQCMVEESRHVGAWLQFLGVAGSGAQERREARKRQAADQKAGADKAAAKAAMQKQRSGRGSPSGGTQWTEGGSAKGSLLGRKQSRESVGSQEEETVEVVVERGRNLAGTYTKKPLKGYLCSVQLRDNKYQTSLAQHPDMPIWKERFTAPVVEIASDLATVMLFVQTEDDGKGNECIGHIAVPVSRIVKKGREEGWYDVTSALSAQGELLSNENGKSGLLVSFRWKGAASSKVSM